MSPCPWHTRPIKELHWARLGSISNWETTTAKEWWEAGRRNRDRAISPSGGLGDSLVLSHLNDIDSLQSQKWWEVIVTEYHPPPAPNQLPTFIQPYILRFFPGICFFSCFLYSLPSESYTSDSSSLDSYNIPFLLNLIPLVFPPGVLTLLY